MRSWQNVVLAGLLLLAGVACLYLGETEAGLLVLGGAVGFATQRGPARAGER